MRRAGGYEPFDPRFARGLIEEVLAPIIDTYFRARLIGADRIPAEGPLVLAANHSGNAFPYDAVVLDTLLWRRDRFDPARKFRSMYEKQLAITWWMRPHGMDNFWRRAGAVDQTFANFDALLGRGDRVIYYPEGVAGIGKGFGQRYRLQPFRTSFVVLAARHRAPVYPVYVVNAEWIVPFNVTLPAVDRLVQRLFGIPFVPLPWALLAALVPCFWYLALPARMVFVVGEPIDVRAVARKEGIDDLERAGRPAVARVAECVRELMQDELDRHVRRYGRTPYQARSLARALARARHSLVGHILPTGWTPAFVRHERDARSQPARSVLDGLRRDWDLAAYYLPFGWPLIALTRRWRRPPCGYRGLSAAERREQEGSFFWDLRERPLPPKGAPRLPRETTRRPARRDSGLGSAAGPAFQSPEAPSLRP